MTMLLLGPRDTWQASQHRYNLYKYIQKEKFFGKNTPKCIHKLSLDTRMRVLTITFVLLLLCVFKFFCGMHVLVV
jgi:hypothetical protein